MSEHEAFGLLARPIQQILWDMQWQKLRPIQTAAIHEILSTDRDIIISARTASGKTEAAFLPILSKIYENPQASLQAIYVSPLKALINDQFRRLEQLCERAQIAVHRWHGDVDASQKKRLIEQPSGVLLITPESIESLFINRSSALSKLFAHLSFVVIDEIHAMVGHERGTQLRSLLYRIERHVTAPYRLIGLSATVGDAFPLYARWLRRDQVADQVCLITDPGEQKRVLYKIFGYWRGQAVQATTNDVSMDTSDLDAEQDVPSDMIAEMLSAFCGRKNLLFTNRKVDVELLADSLNDACRRDGKPPEFLVHHGSLSKEVREFTEEQMRGNRPQTTVCSSTLELGIDIGNVASIGQLGATWSVSSLVQRLGRSGRTDGEAQSMRVFILEDRAGPKASLVDQLYPSLIQAVANSELMLQKWVEPPRIDALDLSTLVQQILSVMAESGGILAATLYDRLAKKGAFPDVGPDLFGQVLRSLARRGLVEQTSDSLLIWV